MKKNLSKILISLFLGFSVASCGVVGEDSSSNNPTDDNASESEFVYVDYTSELKLDLNDTSRAREEVTVYNYVDGDTTHFNASFGDGVVSARYNGIDTPESTGKVEKWGKTASLFTRSKLEGADSIIIESEDLDWHLDSTGSRYLLWVWYRTAGQEDYRLLNLEIVQEGLSLAKAAGSFSYGEYITKAAYQASVLKIRLWDKDAVDENWYDGDAIPITIKELRTNIEEYVQKKVSIEGIITEFQAHMLILKISMKKLKSHMLSHYTWALILLNQLLLVMN